MPSERKKIPEYNHETKNQNIDIACIQETHNVESVIYEENDYRIIIFSPSARTEINEAGNQNANREIKQNGKQLRNKGRGGVEIIYNKLIERDM